MQEDDFEHALRIRAEISAQIQHDMSSHLVNIRNAVRLLQQQITQRASNPENVNRLLDDINFSVSTCLHDLEKVKLLMIDKGAGSNRKKLPVSDLKAMIEECCSRLRSRGRTVEIHSSLEREPGAIFVDRERLWVCLLELLLNAYSFSLRDTVVRVLCRATRGKISIEVSNEYSGRGVPDIDTWFKKGFSMKHDGTGFGLLTVKRLCEAEGFRFSIRFEENEERGLGRVIAGLHIEEQKGA